MSVQPIKEAVKIRRTNKELNDVPEPKYYCSSCLKLKDEMTCDCFKRRVEPNYNRCFFHSFYTPQPISFAVVSNLEELMQLEEVA